MKRTIKVIYKVAKKRFKEILVINIILSAFLTMINFIGVLKLRQHIFAAASGFVFLSMAANIHLMRDCYYDLRNKLRYYAANYLAYIAFYIINLLVGALFDSNVYAWLFSIPKFARFSHLRWSSIQSATLFLVLMLVSVHIAPIGMGGLFEDDGI